MAADGSVAVRDLLKKHQLKDLTEKDIRHVVAHCPKQRFALLEGSSSSPSSGGAGAGGLRIRANQGHSVHIADESQVYQPITDAAKYPTVVHGTTSKLLPVIKREGLSKMRRQHIHFATGLPGASGVRSGMRASCDAFVYIDLAKCLADDIPFFVSQNGVVLSPGVGSTGILPPKYFAKLVTAQQ